jgi:hypothetical protein
MGMNTRKVCAIPLPTESGERPGTFSVGGVVG